MNTTQDLINQITAMAVESRNRVHIHVNYAPHTHEVSARVYRAATDYQDQKDGDVLYSKTVYLDREYYNPTEELNMMIDSLLDIVEGM